MSESEYEPVTPAGQSTTWYTTPVPLSTVQRLNMLHLSVRECGFVSLADSLNAELLCVDRGAAAKRAVAVYSGPECTQLLTTIVSSKPFNQGNCAPELKDFALSLVAETLEREINALVSSKDSQCKMKSFTPEHIEEFTPKQLDAAHRRHAPVLVGPEAVLQA